MRIFWILLIIFFLIIAIEVGYVCVGMIEMGGV